MKIYFSFVGMKVGGKRRLTIPAQQAWVYFNLIASTQNNKKVVYLSMLKFNQKKNYYNIFLNQHSVDDYVVYTS